MLFTWTDILIKIEIFEYHLKFTNLLITIYLLHENIAL